MSRGGNTFQPWAIRYRPGTDLARRFPGTPRGRFPTQEVAERIRAACANAEHMEVINVRAENPCGTRVSGVSRETIGAQNEAAPDGALTPNVQGLTDERSVG